MTRIFTSLVASTAMLAAAPALANNEATDKVLGNICEDTLSWNDAWEDTDLSEQEIAKLRKADYAALDANSDGKVTREEYVECRGQSDKMTKRSVEENRAGDNYVETSWKNLVDSGQSEMTAKEWAAMAAKAWADDDDASKDALSYGGSEAGSENAFARASAQRFKMQDANDDEVLTKEEYESTPSDKREAAYEARFDALDSDGSGDVSAEEYAGTGIDKKSGDDATQIYLYYLEVM